MRRRLVQLFPDFIDAKGKGVGSDCLASFCQESIARSDASENRVEGRFEPAVCF